MILDENSKMKIQAKINGSELRIDGKKSDDLQAAMKLIEDLKTGIPIHGKKLKEVLLFGSDRLTCFPRPNCLNCD